MHVIEFQKKEKKKKGLHHAHILITLKVEYKIMSHNQYDKFVSVEIPYPTRYPILHENILKHMMHDPYGVLKKNNTCMQDGKCKNKYSRPSYSETVQGKNSYLIYRKRNNNHQVLVHNAILDYCWVVPYNSYLLMRYDYHINVEICSTIKVVKYLYKYICKGHDRIVVYVTNNKDDVLVDKIQQFQDA